MKVLHLIAFLEAGGIEKWLLSMLSQMDRRECAMDFCCKLREGYLAPAAREQGASVLVAPFKPSHVEYGRELSRILREGQYDLVHNHMEALSGYPVWICRKLGIPVVTSYHNTHFPPGEQALHSRVLVRLRGLYSGFSIGYALRHSRIVTGCSRAVLESLAPDYAQRSHFRTLYYGVPMPPRPEPGAREAFRRELGFASDAPLLLHVGRMAEQKNHRGLLHIFGRVLKHVPEARLVLVGEGELRGQIEDTIRQNSWEAHVRLLGLRSDVPRVMSLCDQFIFPSLHEGFGLVATEANAAGLPVVGSDISGLNEAVLSQRTALLHPIADEEGMACSIIRLLQDRTAAEAFGEAGRARALAEFSLPAASRRLQELYDECLGNRQRPHDSGL